MIIFSSKPGALGNLLIIYAHLLALSQEYKIKIFVPAFDKYYIYFSGTYKNFIPGYSIQVPALFARITYIIHYYLARIIHRYPIPFIPIKTIHLNFNEKWILNSDEFFKILKQYPILFLQGWEFRTKNLINKHYDYLKNYFEIRKQYTSELQLLFNQFKKKYDTIIAIHIRRGDYIKFENGRYYYDLDFYKNLIIYLKNNLFNNNNVIFYLCSNEPIPESVFTIHSNSRNFKIYISRFNFIQDLYALTQCNYIIGPPSTFSMWASFYNQIPLYMIHHTHDLPKSINDFNISEI